MIAKHYDLGVRGELIAVDFLKNIGYTILDTNWRYLKAEIDIIAIHANKLIVVEVKTRSYDHIIPPQKSVNDKKQKLLVCATNQYILEKNIDMNVQFDIVCVVKNNLGN